MRVSQIIMIAKDYLPIGIGLVVIAVLTYTIGYFLIYKKMMRGTKKIKKVRVIIYSLFFVYIIVVLGATLGRFPIYKMDEFISIEFFRSYKEAWNSFSIYEWRNLILNILMFVPFGMFLPILFSKCKKLWLTYLIGFISTVGLETLQFVTGRGIFDIDDIFNNTVGCMIGYGLIMIFISFINRKKEKRISRVRLAFMQLPLIITVTAFIMIFITYSNQELGNLSIACLSKYDMSNVNVECNLKLNDKEENVPVYKAVVGTKEEAREEAEKIFRAVGAEIDDSKNDVYDETIIFRTTDNNHSVFVNYDGLTTSYSSIFAASGQGKEGMTFDEIKPCLNKFNISLPDNVELVDEGGGNYRITVDMYKDGDILLNGEITCLISEDNIVTNFNNNLIKYVKFKDYEITSEKDAYDKFLNGEFNRYVHSDDDTVKINNLKLSYEMDSKGYYQPTYVFGMESGEEIKIPAIK